MQQTKKTAKYCTKCGEFSLFTESKATYCWDCGTKLIEKQVPKPKKCECGHIPSCQDNFCTHCGKSLANQNTNKTKGVK